LIIKVLKKANDIAHQKEKQNCNLRVENTYIKSYQFSIAMKCQRCKGLLESGSFCQECKNILLPYFENTRDWQMAYEMESMQRSISRYSNVEETKYSEY